MAMLLWEGRVKPQCAGTETPGWEEDSTGRQHWDLCRTWKAPTTTALGGAGVILPPWAAGRATTDRKKDWQWA